MSKELKLNRTKVVDLLEELADVGYYGISYVGSANYQSRENEAKKNLGNKHDELYAKAKKLDETNQELLEALQEMYQWFKNEATDGIQGDALYQAKQAINKALGND